MLTANGVQLRSSGEQLCASQPEHVVQAGDDHDGGQMAAQIQQGAAQGYPGQAQLEGGILALALGVLSGRRKVSKTGEG